MYIEYVKNPKNAKDIHRLYDALGWSEAAGISEEKLKTAVSGSLLSIYAYDGETPVGTGRIISDGAIHTYLCGLGVLAAYRGRGIGSEIVRRLMNHCSEAGLSVQLLCEEGLAGFYEALGFKEFSIGMKK